MKIISSSHPRRQFNRIKRASGMTLIEISLVIALLLGLIAVVFLGIGSYREGADKAKCKIQLAQVQKAVRAYCNFQNLAIGATFGVADAFGTGKAMDSAPVCPSGGTYAWETEVPPVGTPFGNCNYAPTGGVTHVLVLPGGSGIVDTADW